MAGYAPRKLGQRLVNPVGLGCMSLAWAYGTPPTEDESHRLLRRALDLGYDHLDTARIYGMGKSEKLIGEALSGRRSEFYLASKTGIIVDGDKRRIDCRPEVIKAALEESLRLLRTDHIDLYYLHRRDFTIPIQESVGALGELVREGKIGGIGLSEIGADALRKAHAAFPITAVQNEYSLWVRNSEIAVLDACRELGVAFVAFSPVGRGALAGTPLDLSELEASDMRHVFPRYTPENWPHNRALMLEFADLAGNAGLTPAQLAMAWLLSRGDNLHVIPGTTSVPHLEENIATPALAADDPLLLRAVELISPQKIAGPRYPPEMQATSDTEV
jgi:aryl-alcohol dehydrogenase-like predicted oxidoreductase